MGDPVTPFDFYETVVGDAPIRARPIAWDGEIYTNDGRTKTGQFVKPTQYEAACPHCAQTIMFTGNLRGVRCPNCNKGNDVPDLEEFVDPFCDPGQYDTDVDFLGILSEE